MTIAHIITGLGDGGAERSLYQLCVSDTADRHLVYAFRDGVYRSRLTVAGIHVEIIPPLRLFRLWRVLRRIRPDAVQTWMYHADLIGGVVARIAGIRRLFWGIRNDKLVPGVTPRGTTAVAALCAVLSSWVPYRVIFNSRRAVGTHTDNGYAGEKFVVIPNGYDVDRFAPDEVAGRSVRDQWRVAPGAMLVGMVARYDPFKDHENFLSAVSQVGAQGYKISVVLAGSGIDNDNSRLRTVVAELGLTDVVHLVGPRDDIPSVMNALDIHVLSSYSEAFPNVLAEAMACGTPCVTTDVGDAEDVVGDTGWIVPAQQPHALAGAIIDAITECTNDPDRWHDRQTACRRRIVSRFSIERTVSAYRNVWSGGV